MVLKEFPKQGKQSILGVWVRWCIHFWADLSDAMLELLQELHLNLDYLKGNGMELFGFIVSYLCDNCTIASHGQIGVWLLLCSAGLEWSITEELLGIHLPREP